MSPAYTNNPFYSKPQLISGLPIYLFGSYNLDQSNLIIQVQSVAITSNVATVTGLVVEGAPVALNFAPYVGSTISLSQTATSSGLFNVNRATVTAISYDATTNVATVTFALTNANVSATTDAGLAVIDIPENPETLVAEASVAFCIQQQPTQQNGARTLAVACSFPGGLPTAVTVSFQAALHDVDSEYATIGIVTQVTAGAYVSGYSNLAEFTLTEAQYYRVIVSGLTGSAKIVAKVLA